MEFAPTGRMAVAMVQLIPPYAAVAGQIPAADAAVLLTAQLVKVVPDGGLVTPERE